MENMVLVERKGEVATLTLNRSQEGNAVDDATMDALIAALRELSQQQDTRIVLLRGAGEDFCRGRVAPPPAPGTRPTAVQLRDNLRKILTVNSLLSRLPAITLAVVQGRAFGFGAGLATRADLTIAAGNARFAFPEIKGSLPPTVVMSYLRHWLPRKKAMELLLTGKEIDAATAERLGMVNQVVPLARLEEEAQAWVAQLLQVDAASLRLCKECLTDTEHMAPTEAATYGIHLLATFLASR